MVNRALAERAEEQLVAREEAVEERRRGVVQDVRARVHPFRDVGQADEAHAVVRVQEWVGLIPHKAIELLPQRCQLANFRLRFLVAAHVVEENQVVISRLGRAAFPHRSVQHLDQRAHVVTTRIRLPFARLREAEPRLRDLEELRARRRRSQMPRFRRELVPCRRGSAGGRELTQIPDEDQRDCVLTVFSIVQRLSEVVVVPARIA
mmetsp:Transcript_26674/g.85730  ORF Transcript_26674/g.85730 Transcript_26674/m.85730 type:complete len:206 (+) Transcript_26674:1364-1981(+)